MFSTSGKKLSGAGVNARNVSRKQRKNDKLRPATGKKPRKGGSEVEVGQGLGAREATFNANHTIGQGPLPPLGLDWFHVTVADGNGGRVRSFNIDVNFDPPPSKRELMELMAANGLPQDASVVTDRGDCIVWRSVILGRLMGADYAEARVEPGVNNFAEMEATAQPECR